jgi:hypothetical protein
MIMPTPRQGFDLNKVESWFFEPAHQEDDMMPAKLTIGLASGGGIVLLGEDAEWTNELLRSTALKIYPREG